LCEVFVIRSNSILYSSRVEKIFRSLSRKYNVSVLGWNREGLASSLVEKSYEGHLKLFSLKAPFGRLSLIAYLPLFWIWIIVQLFRYRPRIVHACDLDTVIPGYLYKIMLKKKLVFDICDRYAMAYINPKHRGLYLIVNLCEEFFSKKSDALILNWNKVVNTFRTKPKSYVIITNCPSIESEGIPIENPKDVFTLVYTGGIRKDRSLENIIAAISYLHNLELIIAGRAVDKEMTNKILKLPNVKYKGTLPPRDALLLESSADVIIVLNDPKVPWNNLSIPTRIFEGMMFKKPIITNMAPELINKFNCGILVDYENINQIKEAIVSLQNNPKQRISLGNNGYEGFLKRYNWDVMEKELFKIYEELTRK
jgi:glycosyltransferase involved in cell wall biosynthesis